MVIAYDGTQYRGWQLQPTAPTVLRCIEAALSTALREDRLKLGVGATGRTDAGVHASGQVRARRQQAHASSPAMRPTGRLCCNAGCPATYLAFSINAAQPVDSRASYQQ